MKPDAQCSKGLLRNDAFVPEFIVSLPHSDTGFSANDHETQIIKLEVGTGGPIVATYDTNIIVNEDNLGMK